MNETESVLSGSTFMTQARNLPMDRNQTEDEWSRFELYDIGKKQRESIEKQKEETAMKKKYKLDEIDCANCALKLENAIREIDGVSDVKVNYMMQKMTIEADDASFDDVEKKVIATCKRMEPDMDVNAV